MRRRIFDLLVSAASHRRCVRRDADVFNDAVFRPVIPPSQAAEHIEATAEIELLRYAAQDGMERRLRKHLLVDVAQ